MASFVLREWKSYVMIRHIFFLLLQKNTWMEKKYKTPSSLSVGVKKETEFALEQISSLNIGNSSTRNLSLLIPRFASEREKSLAEWLMHYSGSALTPKWKGTILVWFEEGSSSSVIEWLPFLGVYDSQKREEKRMVTQGKKEKIRVVCRATNRRFLLLWTWGKGSKSSFSNSSSSSSNSNPLLYTVCTFFLSAFFAREK